MKHTKLPMTLKEVVDDPNRFRRGWDLCLTHMICGQHEGENCVGICVYEDQTIKDFTRIEKQRDELLALVCDAHDHLLAYSPAPKSDELIKAIRKAVAEVDKSKQAIQSVEGEDDGL